MVILSKQQGIHKNHGGLLKKIGVGLGIAGVLSLGIGMMATPFDLLLAAAEEEQATAIGGV